MNERGVEVLVKAALDGVPQAVGALRLPSGAMCAMGVLLDDIIQRQGAEWLPCGGGVGDVVFDAPKPVRDAVITDFAIDDAEWSRIVHRNNERRWDFLTIARKLGPDAA